ncbi:hypothetical protein R6Q57_021252 [Mikania cordata]
MNLKLKEPEIGLYLAKNLKSALIDDKSEKSLENPGVRQLKTTIENESEGEKRQSKVKVKQKIAIGNEIAINVEIGKGKEDGVLEKSDPRQKILGPPFLRMEEVRKMGLYAASVAINEASKLIMKHK